MELLLFAERDILERVDEYALYCHYLDKEIIIGAKYHSPIRPASLYDDDPSFGIYERKLGQGPHEFLWKDQAIGKCGDIFDLVVLLYNFETRRKAMDKILHDFCIQECGVMATIPMRTERVYAECTHIEVSSKPFTKTDFTYWKQFNITEQILNRYNTTAVRHFWLTEEQKTPSYPKGLGYSYRIWDKYQLYFPYAYSKRQKFRSNLTNICVPGFLQLQRRGELCIITKSFKDVMCLDSFGYEAVSPRGESILLPQECIAWLKRQYKHVLVLFDNDMKHKGDEYPFPKIYVPKLIDFDKDPSDFCKNHGPHECADMLRQIIGNEINQ